MCCSKSCKKIRCHRDSFSDLCLWIWKRLPWKCLAKEQSLRYDSAKALAEDLQRYVNGEPIVARKASLAYRLGKQIRKQKSLFALSLLSLLFISALVTDRLCVHFQHARQAKIVKAQIERARVLGQDAKETEWFMRAVYELPIRMT